MNQTFSLRRFGVLARLHSNEYGRTYLLGFLVIAGLLLIIMLPLVLATTNEAGRRIAYQWHELALVGFLTLIYPCLMTVAFQPYNAMSRGMATLMLPVSQAEKFLIIWLPNLLILPVFLAFYFAVHIPVVALANAHLAALEHPLRVINLMDIDYQMVLYVSILLQAIGFLGSVYFPKAALIKSAVFVVLAIFSVSYLNQFALHLLLKTGIVMGEIPLLDSGVILNGNAVWLVQDATVRALAIGVLLFMPVAFWFIAFVRLTEKQI